MRILYLLLCSLTVIGCSQRNEPRFVIKTSPINNEEYIEWYNYSLIGDYGVDRVDFVNSSGERNLIYKSHYLSDISYDSGVIVLNWWKRSTAVEELKEISGYKIQIDSGGCSLMSSSSRRSLGDKWHEEICLRFCEYH